MKLKPIVLVTKAAVDFSDVRGDKAIMDIVNHVGSVGHEDIPFNLDWNDEDECPAFKEFLVKTYGDGIKEHGEFILLSC